MKEPAQAGKKPPRAGLSAGAGFAHPGGCACTGCRAFAALAADPAGVDVEAELDALFAQELADWEEVADPIFAALRAGLAKAKSYDELIALLSEMVGEGGSDQLAERLARLTAIARGLGDVAD